jgi:hypothetical protein
MPSDGIEAIGRVVDVGRRRTEESVTSSQRTERSPKGGDPLAGVVEQVAKGFQQIDHEGVSYLVDHSREFVL